MIFVSLVDRAKREGNIRVERLAQAMQKMKNTQEETLHNIIEAFKVKNNFQRLQNRIIELDHQLGRSQALFAEKKYTYNIRKAENNASAEELRIKHEAEMETTIRGLLGQVDSKTKEVEHSRYKQDTLRKDIDRQCHELSQLLFDIEKEEKERLKELKNKQNNSRMGNIIRKKLLSKNNFNIISSDTLATTNSGSNPSSPTRRSSLNNTNNSDMQQSQQELSILDVFPFITVGSITEEMLKEAENMTQSVKTQLEEQLLVTEAAEQRLAGKKSELAAILKSEENKALERLKKMCGNLEIKIDSDSKRATLLETLVKNLEKEKDGSSGGGVGGGSRMSSRGNSRAVSRLGSSSNRRSSSRGKGDKDDNSSTSSDDNNNTSNTTNKKQKKMKINNRSSSIASLASAGTNTTQTTHDSEKYVALQTKFLQATREVRKSTKLQMKEQRRHTQQQEQQGQQQLQLQQQKSRNSTVVVAVGGTSLTAPFSAVDATSLVQPQQQQVVSVMGKAELLFTDTPSKMMVPTHPSSLSPVPSLPSTTFNNNSDGDSDSVNSTLTLPNVPKIRRVIAPHQTGRIQAALDMLTLFTTPSFSNANRGNNSNVLIPFSHSPVNNNTSSAAANNVRQGISRGQRSQVNSASSSNGNNNNSPNNPSSSNTTFNNKNPAAALMSPLVRRPLRVASPALSSPVPPSLLSTKGQNSFAEGSAEGLMITGEEKPILVMDDSRLTTAASTIAAMTKPSTALTQSQQQQQSEEEQQEQAQEQQREVNLDHDQAMLPASMSKPPTAPRPSSSRAASAISRSGAAAGLLTGSFMHHQHSTNNSGNSTAAKTQRQREDEFLPSVEEKHRMISKQQQAMIAEENEKANFYTQNFGFRAALEQLTTIMELLTHWGSALPDSVSLTAMREALFNVGLSITTEDEQLENVEALRHHTQQLILQLKVAYRQNDNVQTTLKHASKEMSEELRRCEELKRQLLHETEGLRWGDALQPGKFQAEINGLKRRITELKSQLRQWEQQIQQRRKSNIRLSQRISDQVTARKIAESVAEKLKGSSQAELEQLSMSGQADIGDAQQREEINRSRSHDRQSHDHAHPQLQLGTILEGDEPRSNRNSVLAKQSLELNKSLELDSNSNHSNNSERRFSRVAHRTKIYQETTNIYARGVGNNSGGNV